MKRPVCPTFPNSESKIGSNMAANYQPPFSVRNRRNIAAIDEAFPQTAIVGLRHIISDGIKRCFIASWREVARELARISRDPPEDYDRKSFTAAEVEATVALDSLRWDRVYDFCERLYSYLTQDVEYENFGELIRITKAEGQQFVADELQRLFQEENLAFEFKDGLVQRRGRRHTVEQVTKAEGTLTEARLRNARNHFTKAQRYFRDRNKPDPENVVKEAVCAVEAAARELFPNSKGRTLEDVVKWLRGTEDGKLPPSIATTFIGLYAFRGGGDGVAHGGATGGTATKNIAEYALAVAASQIILLVDLARTQEEDTPF